MHIISVQGPRKGYVNIVIVLKALVGGIAESANGIGMNKARQRTKPAIEPIRNCLFIIDHGACSRILLALKARR